MFKKIVLMTSLSLAMGTAHAGYLFTPSISHVDQKLQDGSNPEVSGKMTLIDFRLGYVFDSGLYLGGLYALHNHEFLTNSSDSYVGPSIGYFYSGLLFAGTYYLYGERDLTQGGIKYADVKGFQLDISYAIPLSETVSIGPQLSYHSIAFDEVHVSGSAQPTEYSFSGISPYFNVTITF